MGGLEARRETRSWSDEGCFCGVLWRFAGNCRVIEKCDAAEDMVEIGSGER